MPDSLSTRQSSRLRRKAPVESPEEKDFSSAEYIANCLARLRQNRDDLEHQLVRDFGLSDTVSEDFIKNVVATKMEKIDSSVGKLETNVAGTQLESLLRDPHYGSPIKSKPSPVKAKAVPPPIEIKVEDTSACQSPLHSCTCDNQVLTVNTSVSGASGPDTVEKAAKQEAHTMARIAELRRAGMWSNARLPLCVELPRNKTHWDFVLEEVKWMANDFRQERKWKRSTARKLASTIARQCREKEMEIEKAQMRAVRDERRACASIAKMIRDFWQNVDKVVDHKKQSIIEAKKRKALDQHLQFIVGEADKLSQVVAEGIVDGSSKSPSIQGNDDDRDDKDFSGMESESDDETTIAKAEKNLKGDDVKGEIYALGKEAHMEFDDLLDSLPPEYLAALGLNVPSTSKKVIEELKEEEEDDDEDEDDDSEDEGEEDDNDPMMKPGTSKDDNEEIKEEEEANDNDDDEPLIKKIRRSSIIVNEDEEDEDDETISSKIRKSREDTVDSVNRDASTKDTTDSPQTEAEENVKLENVDFKKLKSENSDERQLELTHIAEEALKFQPKGYTLETTQVKTGVPHLLRGTLREYQMVGLDWLVTLYDKNLNGILADEMGLGKTIQTAALLAHLASVERIWGPHLIVVPTSVILNWEMELKKWVPALKILTYFGSVKERAEKRRGWLKPNSFHVCITSYKVVTTDIRSFKMRAWQYLILDEAQNIKNWKSQRWQTLLNVRARRRLLLTGTPLQNSLMELWSLLHFLMPAIFGSHDDFKDWFSNPLTGMMEGSVEFNKGLLDRLHKVLRPFILRRMKAEVEKQLPEKTEHVVKCPLSKRQRYLYDDFMSQRQTRDNLKSGNMMSVLNIVMQLRKCCNHPNLFSPREEQTPLVISPITRVLPSILFDIITDTPQSYSTKEIPHCLDLNNKKAAWRSQVRSTRPLIEELDSMDVPLKIPRVPGFKFSNAVMSKTASQPPRAPEMYLVVDDGNDIGGLLQERVQVTLDGDTVSVNASGGNIVGDKIRVYQAGPDGSFQDVPSGNTCSPSRRTTWKGSSEVNGSSIESTDTPSTPSLSNTSIETKRSSLSAYTSRRLTSIPHNAIGTTTVLHPQPGMKETNGESGRNRSVHDAMKEGTLEPFPRFPIPLSPPIKRRRIDPLISGAYKELIPKDMIDKWEEERRKRMEKALDRFNHIHTPFYSYQLMSLIWRETRTKSVKERSKWCHSFWNGERNEIQEWLWKEIDELTNKFIIYVDGALCDSPSIVVSTKGRTSYARHGDIHMKELSRRFIESCDPVVNANLLAHRMQFPELRLIEYDCGKLQMLSKLLRELFLYKHRCLIFTQMSKMLDVLQAFLSHHGYQYFRLDGTTPVEQRQAMMERFNADNRIFCFILSTRSGGVGINLTGADTVIFYDSDWNPTMDAQAQDRCHRIGQTRNVSIYRLISERTIEENILRKAMQKRRLGEMAIDDAGFTPDFFRQKDNIRDLFDGEDVEDLEVEAPIDAPTNQIELDKVMASLEDEQDVVAARIVANEVKADVKEFDDRMIASSSTILPSNGEDDEKFSELLSQLKPIERYAINYLVHEGKNEFEEEVKEAEALLIQKQAEWNRAHEKAQKAEDDMNDPLLSAANTSLDEEFHDLDVILEDEFMPTWRPLTPPLSDGGGDELYWNELNDELYEDIVMDDSRLPSSIHDLHKPLIKYNTSPSKKQEEHSVVLELLNAASPLISSSNDQSNGGDNQNKLNLSISQPPPSNTGLPSSSSVSSIISMEPSIRRAPSTKRSSRALYDAIIPGRSSKGDMRRPTTPPPAEREAKDYEGPEWTILEDYALLQAVISEQRLTHMPANEKTGLKLNWEYISGFVNRVTGNYRSPRQCSVHYQMCVLPREEGRIVTIDPLTKKPRKLCLSNTELSHMRKGRTSTHLQYECDVQSVLKEKMIDRMRVMKRLKERREPSFVRHCPSSPISGVPRRQMERFRRLFPESPPSSSPLDILLLREEKRMIQVAQDKEMRARHEIAVAEERLQSSQSSSSMNAIVVRPSAMSFISGVLITPPMIQLEVPPPSRIHIPSLTHSHSLPHSLSSSTSSSSLQSSTPLLPHSQHPISEHLPSLPRRIPSSSHHQQGSNVIMEVGSSNQSSHSHSQSNSPSPYLVVSNSEGQSQRMQAVLARGTVDGQSISQSAISVQGGQNAPMYRTLPPGAQKRPAAGSIGRMAQYITQASAEGVNPNGNPIHVVRGTPVQRDTVGGPIRQSFNTQRVNAQRTMTSQAARMYMTNNGGGGGSGSSSPSQSMNEQGGTIGGQQQPPQGGRAYMMSSHLNTVRVGMAPQQRMGGGGGNGVNIPHNKRANSLIPPKTNPGTMIMTRPGQGTMGVRGPTISRFGSGGTGGNQGGRMMNVVVRDGQRGQLIQGGSSTPSNQSNNTIIMPGTCQVSSRPIGTTARSVVASRLGPSNQSIQSSNQSIQSSQTPPISSSSSPSTHTISMEEENNESSSPSTDNIGMIQSNPLPPLSLPPPPPPSSSSSSSSSFPNTSSHTSI